MVMPTVLVAMTGVRFLHRRVAMVARASKPVPMHVSPKIVVRGLMRMRMGNARHLTGEVTHDEHGS